MGHYAQRPTKIPEYWISTCVNAVLSLIGQKLLPDGSNTLLYKYT